jgi:hypothetical protein
LIVLILFLKVEIVVEEVVAVAVAEEAAVVEAVGTGIGSAPILGDFSLSLCLICHFIVS